MAHNVLSLPGRGKASATPEALGMVGAYPQTAHEVAPHILTKKHCFTSAFPSLHPLQTLWSWPAPGFQQRGQVVCGCPKAAEAGKEHNSPRRARCRADEIIILMAFAVQSSGKKTFFSNKIGSLSPALHEKSNLNFREMHIFFISVCQRLEEIYLSRHQSV